MAVSISRRLALSLLAGLPLARCREAGGPIGVLRRIVPGFSHTLVVEPDGTLACWSSSTSPNLYGEFGLGHRRLIRRYTRTPIPGLMGVVAAGAGLDCSFAVLNDGRIMAWGVKTAGMLGITPLVELERTATARWDSVSPVEVAADIDGVAIAVGGRHVLALGRDRGVWAWGDGANGRLGIGAMPVVNFKNVPPGVVDYQPYPLRVPNLTRVTAVSAGFQHSLALLEDGTIRAWGSNSHGQLGDGSVKDRAVPVQVAGIRNAVAIEAGARFSVAALADGSVMTWGSHLDAALGRAPANADEPSFDPLPGLVPGVAHVRAVSAGGGHVLALTRDATVVSWGRDVRGQAGQGGEETTRGAMRSPRPPKTIEGLSDVVSAVADRERSYAVLANGSILTWGAPVRERQDATGETGDMSAVPIRLEVEGLT